MNKLDQTVDEYLRAIGASCPRLLFALHESPEAVWGEIMRMESAYYAFEKACSGLQDKSAAAREIMTLVRALRVQMAKDGSLTMRSLPRSGRAYRPSSVARTGCGIRSVKKARGAIAA